MIKVVVEVLGAVHAGHGFERSEADDVMAETAA